MKVFSCPKCSHPIFFENNICLNCNSKVGFSVYHFDFVLVDDHHHHSIYCTNYARDVCNWVVRNIETDQFCLACSFNGLIPTYEDTVNFEKWREMEMAKHRLIYQLLVLQLPLIPKSKDQINGLSFDFLVADNTSNRMTGHANGLVTTLLDEGDPVHREQMRKQLSSLSNTSRALPTRNRPLLLDATL
ncbi:MAG: putative zinc-binding metallopeptidase [Saprospiraceae bacterium]|nr:putative zinc-binding metallopeptidase [Saprospiraceae bacterium]